MGQVVQFRTQEKKPPKVDLGRLRAGLALQMADLSRAQLEAVQNLLLKFQVADQTG